MCQRGYGKTEDIDTQLNNKPLSKGCCVCLLKAAGKNLQKVYESEHDKPTELPWRHVLDQSEEQKEEYNQANVHDGGNGKRTKDSIQRDATTNIARPKIYFVPPRSVAVIALMTDLIPRDASKNTTRMKIYFVPPGSVSIISPMKNLMSFDAPTNISR